MKRLSENEKSLATFGIGALIGYLMPKWLRNTILLIFFGLLAYGYALNSCTPDKAPVEPTNLSMNDTTSSELKTLSDGFRWYREGNCDQSLSPSAWYQSEIANGRTSNRIRARIIVDPKTHEPESIRGLIDEAGEGMVWLDTINWYTSQEICHQKTIETWCENTEKGTCGIEDLDYDWAKEKSVANDYR